MKAFIVCMTVSLDVKAHGSFQEIYTHILTTPHGLVPAGIMIIYLRIKSTMNEVPYVYMMCQVHMPIKKVRRRVHIIKGCGMRVSLLGHIHAEPNRFDTHNWLVGWWEARVMRK